MKEIFGGILLAVGILVAGASGLCSLVVLFGFGSSDLSMIPLVLVVGGIPFAIGFGIGFGGWALIKSARRDRQRDVGDTFE
ncbi:MAG TPA: hypothetical protein VF079_08855 [Sphingomicrobium sp.]